MREKHKHISKLKNREFYRELISRKYARPSALYKWEEQYFYVNFDWKLIFLHPYTHISDTKLQSLQYQIIHRYFPCRYNLSKWYHTNEENCNTCTNKRDTIEHFFYECIPVKKLWEDLTKWFKNATLTSFPLGCLDVLFGVSNNNNETYLNALNFCIILCKAFISQQKSKLQDITLHLFLKKLSKRLESEKYIAMINNRYDDFEETYGAIYTHCLNDGYVY